MIEELSKYKDTFLSEAKEHIRAMESSLLKLEKNPSEIQLVNDIFREAHTLKSMAATMDYDKIATLCHAIEDVLDGMKKKKIRLEKCVDLLFECFDTLELSLKEIFKDKKELDTTMLVEKLQALSTKDETERTTDEGRERADKSEVVEKIQSIEVKVERLDLLMNLAEELLINKMRLDRIKETLQDPELSAAVDTLGRLVADVQYNVMQSRMVPIGFVFNRFPRMVRDLAKHQKKEVNLEMQGMDIELDRVVIDEIGETLVHLLRNAVDHGIEMPGERKKAGKHPQGTIRLIATRTKNFAVVQVTDDGAGLNIEDIKNTAIKRGILSPQASKEDVMNATFFGVSTTKQITAVSGRGFGLNIVKDKIESLGGAIKVESEPKKGTTFIIEIPLTLAIIKTLFVELAGKPYAIPLANIERLITVKKEDIKGMMNYEAIVLDEEDIPITRLNVLFGSVRSNPDKNRDDVPSVQTSKEVGAPYLTRRKQPIVIIRRGEEKLGLAVDAFSTTQEIVIKPLNKVVRENRYFSGSTIIGSGEVVLILDVSNLILSKRTQVSIAESSQ